ncbi:maltose ABC transporter substrate-binding protein [uncultured Actinomyces sp.]|uniref:sugar ABC transporter substrate-binding protein n=1 Tax=uncultured Actinomyces sp. TaxID=249061 RepID=UPI0028F14C10|nr:maltose ABC transporter substrate-binding protein [uncultured Actinomyces sp.]
MRRGIAVCGVLAVTATLAACSNGSSSSSSSQSASASASSVGSLTVWADDTRYSQIQELAKDFTAATKVDVQVVQKSETNMDQEFISQVPTGNGPDIIVMAHDKLGQLVQNGVVSPVDLGEAKSKFSEAAIQGVTYDGKTYGVPYAVESVALVRNNKLTTDTPKTFDEMIASGKKAGSEYPFVVQMSTDGDPYHLYAFQTSFGNEVFKQSADGSYTSELTLGGTGATEFAQWLKEQGEAKTLNPNITSDVAKTAFLQGNAAYMVTGPWNVTAAKEAGLDVSVLPIPSAGGKEARPFVGVQMFYQSSKTQNQVLVNKFFQYLETKEAQSKLQELGGRVPAMTEVADSLTDENLKQFASVAGSGLPMPAIPAMGSVWDYWGKTQVAIVNGADPVSSWETMVNNIQASINK